MQDTNSLAVVRRNLALIRKSWNEASAERPFVFTLQTREGITIEDFAVRFLRKKQDKKKS